MLAGVAHQLGAGVQAQFFGHVGAVAFDGAHAELELFGDLAVGVALDDETQHIGFAQGEHLGGGDRLWGGCGRFVEQGGDHFGMDVDIAKLHSMDGRDELGFGSVLDDVTGGAGMDGLAQQGFFFMDGENQDLYLRLQGLDAAGDLDPIQVGHAVVHHHHIRGQGLVKC